MDNNEFLKDFAKRMKSVGRYAVLVRNSMQKSTWKQYGIESLDEQMNLIFTVLLYVMEYSLKEEDCTIDDIAAFIREVNDRYYKKKYSYEKDKELADFIINVILGNSGSSMYFNAYDYSEKEYKEISISYIANKIVYQEDGIRRTSYYLTEEGYNMMLSTMELENNLKLTVHEMLFKLHLEKADYSRAVNDIKNVFDQLRIQNLKIQEAMHRIRQNALAYSVEEYRQLVEENIGTVEKTRSQFRAHQEVVDTRVKEFEEQEIDSASFNEKDRESLNNLREISTYLSRALDEHQKIIGEHFDLKSLYDRELENYTNMTMVQRFHIRSEIYDRVLKNPMLLEGMSDIIRPLLFKPVEKIYNPNKAFEYQKKLLKSEETDDESTVMEDDEGYLELEKEKQRKELLAKYKGSCELIVSFLYENQKISISMIKSEIWEQQKEYRQILIPTAEIFREIMMELLTVGEITIKELKKERSEHMTDQADSFQLNETLLTIIEEHHYNSIKKIYVRKASTDSMVSIEPVKDQYGRDSRIACADIDIWYE